MESMLMSGVVSFSPTTELKEEVSTTLQHLTVYVSQANAWPSVVQPGSSTRAAAWNQLSPVEELPRICGRRDWLDDEYRQAYMESTVEQDIAYQIAAVRRARGMTQTALADKVGTRQSSIARAEDPEYGRHSIPTLIKIAHALDVALRIKFISYQELAEEVADTSPEALFVPAFAEQRVLINTLRSLEHDCDE